MIYHFLDALQKHQKVKKKKPKHTKDVDDYGIRKVFKAFKDDINAGVSADELMEVTLLFFLAIFLII